MKRPVKIALGIAALVVFCGAGYWAIAYRSEARAQAVRFSWMRAQVIQRWQTVVESDWGIPSAGRKVREYSAVHHWDHYVSGSHQACSGSGTDRRCKTELDYSDRPVYWTKYDYEIERWVIARTPTLQADDQRPIWPDVTDIHEAHDPLQIGDERAGMRSSRYTIALEAPGAHYTLDITEERWTAFEPGAYYVVVCNILGQPVDIREQRV